MRATPTDRAPSATSSGCSGWPVRCAATTAIRTVGAATGVPRANLLAAGPPRANPLAAAAPVSGPVAAPDPRGTSETCAATTRHPSANRTQVWLCLPSTARSG